MNSKLANSTSFNEPASLQNFACGRLFHGLRPACLTIGRHASLHDCKRNQTCGNTLKQTTNKRTPLVGTHESMRWPIKYRRGTPTPTLPFPIYKILHALSLPLSLVKGDTFNATLRGTFTTLSRKWTITYPRMRARSFSRQMKPCPSYENFESTLGAAIPTPLIPSPSIPAKLHEKGPGRLTSGRSPICRECEVPPHSAPLSHHFRIFVSHVPLPRFDRRRLRGIFGWEGGAAEPYRTVRAMQGGKKDVSAHATKRETERQARKIA